MYRSQQRYNRFNSWDRQQYRGESSSGPNQSEQSYQQNYQQNYLQNYQQQSNRYDSGRLAVDRFRTGLKPFTTVEMTNRGDRLAEPIKPKQQQLWHSKRDGK